MRFDYSGRSINTVIDLIRLFDEIPSQYRFTANHVSKHQGVHIMSTQSVTVERRILRRPEVEAKTGFKRAYLYRLMQEGKFPKTIPLGVRAVGWDSVEVDQWIAERLKERV
jgi:prophage regulatory protein